MKCSDFSGHYIVIISNLENRGLLQSDFHTIFKQSDYLFSNSYNNTYELQ